MTHKTTLFTVSFVLIMLTFQKTGFCQNIEKELAIFNNYINKDWVGHYIDSEDSIYKHYISWKFDKKNKAVIETKNVPELGYHQETSYYWNWAEKQLAFISSNNKEMISSGVVQFVGDKIVLEGKTFSSQGYSLFKKTLILNSNEKIVDLFYWKNGSDWQQGHRIEYELQNPELLK